MQVNEDSIGRQAQRDGHDHFGETQLSSLAFLKRLQS